VCRTMKPVRLPRSGDRKVSLGLYYNGELKPGFGFSDFAVVEPKIVQQGPCWATSCQERLGCDSSSMSSTSPSLPGSSTFPPALEMLLEKRAARNGKVFLDKGREGIYREGWGRNSTACKVCCRL